MGYYTDHTMSIIEGDDSLIQELREENEEAYYSILENGDINQSSKWYSHKEELIEFSRKNPGALIKLSGEGEESGDLWDEYYINGKIQVCKGVVVIPPFDKSLLI